MAAYKGCARGRQGASVNLTDRFNTRGVIPQVSEGLRSGPHESSEQARGWPSWFAGFVVAPMQVIEDLSDGIGLGHSGNHPHFATALGTDADVEIEHPFEPGHPAHRGVGAGVVAGWAAGSASSSRDDEMAVAGIGGEQAVVAHQVGLGPRHQSGQGARGCKTRTGERAARRCAERCVWRAREDEDGAGAVAGGVRRAQATARLVQAPALRAEVGEAPRHRPGRATQSAGRARG